MSRATRYLIDTCAFAEYAKPVPNTRVVDWMDELAQDEAYLSVLTIGEIHKGIFRLPSSKRKKALTAFLTELLDRFDRQVLDLTTATMLRWGQLMVELENKGRTLPIIDSLLAATALEHDLTLVTRNTRDFEPAGIPVLDLWD